MMHPANDIGLCSLSLIKCLDMRLFFVLFTLILFQNAESQTDSLKQAFNFPETRMKVSPYKMGIVYRHLLLNRWTPPVWESSMAPIQNVLTWEAEVEVYGKKETWKCMAGEMALGYYPGKQWESAADSFVVQLSRNINADLTLQTLYLRGRMLRDKRAKFGKHVVLNFFQTPKTAYLQVHTSGNYLVFAMVITPRNPEDFLPVRKFFATLQVP